VTYNTNGNVVSDVTTTTETSTVWHDDGSTTVTTEYWKADGTVNYRTTETTSWDGNLDTLNTFNAAGVQQSSTTTQKSVLTNGDEQTVVTYYGNPANLTQVTVTY
jgi:hypothetical protein